MAKSPYKPYQPKPEQMALVPHVSGNPDNPAIVEARAIRSEKVTVRDEKKWYVEQLLRRKESSANRRTSKFLL